MHRIHVPGAREFIRETIEALPARLQQLLKPIGFLVGLSPAYAGLHGDTDTGDGRSYQSTAHFLYESCLLHLPRSARQPTVFIPREDVGDERMLLHELGHALDEQLGFSTPLSIPLDDYAATDEYEATATAFQSWATLSGPDECYFHTRAVLKTKDPNTVAFWDSLCREGR